jgi:hypothetical protein
MNPRRPAPLHATLARVAITGAASLATVLAAAPGAFADDDELAPVDSSAQTEETPDETPAEDSAESADESGTADETPDPALEESPDPRAADDAPADETDDVDEAVLEDVEPDYGFQKFRVGVRIADGTTVPDGASTVGSTIRITRTDLDGNVTTATCTTEEPLEDPFADELDETPEDPTASFCMPLEDLPDEIPLELARGAASVGDDDDFFPEQYFEVEPGDTVTLQQLTAGPGLVPAPDVVTIDPCEAAPIEFLPIDFGACPSGDFEATPFLTTKVVFENGVDDVDPAADTDDDAVEDDVVSAAQALPNVGGADAGLLALGGLLVAGGSALTMHGRRRPRVLVD